MKSAFPLFHPPPFRYYLNALFDLELGGFPVAALRRSAAEMTALFVALAQQSDTVVLDVDLPDEYFRYLHEAGFELYSGADRPDCADRSPTDIVWGWNREAAIRLSAHFDEARGEAVKAINSRRFSSQLADMHGFGVPHSRFCVNMDEVRTAMEQCPHSGPAVIKPAFGGAGFGFVMALRNGLSDKEWLQIENHLCHGGVVVEPWLDRTVDLSTAIHVTRQGNVGELRFQRQLVNSHGAFYGIYCSHHDPFMDEWRDELERVALIVAGEASASGYSGFIGVDSFVYRSAGGEERLAAGIEINGRFTMGILAQLLFDRIAAPFPALLRFISAKKGRLPQSYEEWKRLLSNNIFDPQTRCGVILLTPLRAGYQGKWAQPLRSAFLLVAPSEKEILELDDRLRAALRP